MPHLLLYLVRHGAYDPDPSDPIDGGTLNELGRQQASLLADRLAGIPFDAVHHSSALRAVQTADLLAFGMAPDLPRFSDDMLRECIPALPGDEHLTESQREFFSQLPAEARDEGPQRAKSAVERYTAPLDNDRRELIVSHGNLINFFVSDAMDAPTHGWLRPLDYHCGLTIIRYNTDSPPRLITYNEVGHLPEELRGVEYPEDFRV